MTCLRCAFRVFLVALLWTRLASGQELDLEAFDRYAKASFAAYEVPGAAVAIVKDESLVLAKGFGVRTLGDPTPVDADTLFALASCSKAFTVALMATLVDEGKVSWDDRVIDRLTSSINSIGSLDQ